MDASARLVNLVGQIYDAGENPGLWPGTLSQLAAEFHSNAAVLTLEDNRSPRSLISAVHGMDPAWQDSYLRHYQSINIVLQKGLPHFSTGHLIFSHEYLEDKELTASEYHNDFLKPQDWFYHCGGWVKNGDEANLLLTLMRSRKHGTWPGEEQDRLNALLPHLARASRIHTVLQHVRDYEQAFDSLPTGVILLNSRGRVLRSNIAAQRIFEARDGLEIDRDGQLWAGRQTPALKHAIASALKVDLNRFGQERFLRVSRRSQRSPYVVSAGAIRESSALFGLTGKLAVLFVIDPESKPSPLALQQLFGLTRAESALAMQLIDGKSLDEAADHLSIQRNTVKTQLNRLFDKVGVRRQASLLAILLRSLPAATSTEE